MLVRQPERLSDAICYFTLAKGKLVNPVIAITAFDRARRRLRGRAHPRRTRRGDGPHHVTHHDEDALLRGRRANDVSFSEYTALLSGDMLLTRLTLEQLARDNAELSVVPAEHVFRAVSELGNAADARGVAAGQVTDKASESLPASLPMWSTSIYTTRLCASSSSLVASST
jgi:geranylgeranyl pyrophosphate synthase